MNVFLMVLSPYGYKGNYGVSKEITDAIFMVEDRRSMSQPRRLTYYVPRFTKWMYFCEGDEFLGFMEEGCDAVQNIS